MAAVKWAERTGEPTPVPCHVGGDVRTGYQQAYVKVTVADNSDPVSLANPTRETGSVTVVPDEDGQRPTQEEFDAAVAAAAGTLGTAPTNSPIPL